MKTKTILSHAGIALAGILGVVSASGAVVWNETTHGDLSDDNLAPTTLSFGIGENRVEGQMGRDDVIFPIDRDLFTVTLSAGQQLTSIRVDSLTGAGGAGSFYAIGPGTQISISNPGAHLSNTLVNQTGEVLDDLINNPYQGGTGISGPLGPGTYTFWLQETSAEIGYSMTYTVVPEPGAIGVVVAGLCGAVAAWRRNRC